MMGWDLCNQTTQKAQKDYHCDACHFIQEYLNQGIFSFAEMRQIVKAKRNNWKIKKGEVYEKVSGKWDGDFAVFRAIPAMDALCIEHELYPEE